MTYLSILEKFEILFNTLMDFEFVLVFALLILFFTILYTIKKLSGKKYILYIFLTFTLLFGISIVKNYDILSSTFENFTTIFFGNIYFPSIYVYISILVVSFIAFITSMINAMLKKIYKVINSIMFALNNILFVVILNIIAKNKIDIFSVNSLYADTNLVAILELSMGLCVLWILSLLVVYITNAICDRMANKRIVNEEKREIFNPIIEISDNIISDVNNQDIEEEIINDNKLNNELTSLIENNNENLVEIEEVTSEEQEEILYKDNNEENSIDNRVTFNDILNGCIPVTYYDNSNIIEEYNLINPQIVYEDNYNKIKNDIVFNDLNVTLNNTEEISTIDNIKISNNIENNNAILNEYVMEDLSVEKLTLKEKEKVSQERLISNTISLNDLIEEENNNIDIIEYNINESDIEEEYKDYTIDDYKRIVKMLNSLKKHSSSNDIKIDDAVAISLISNYSVDDCLKFKNILENNLN